MQCVTRRQHVSIYKTLNTITQTYIYLKSYGGSNIFTMKSSSEDF